MLAQGRVDHPGRPRFERLIAGERNRQPAPATAAISAGDAPQALPDFRSWRTLVDEFERRLPRFASSAAVTTSRVRRRSPASSATTSAISCEKHGLRGIETGRGAPRDRRSVHGAGPRSTRRPATEDPATERPTPGASGDDDVVAHPEAGGRVHLVRTWGR